MTEFFDFTIWFASQAVAFLMKLPFMSGFSFGHMLVALVLLGVIIAALVGTLAVANFSHEARQGGR